LTGAKINNVSEYSKIQGDINFVQEFYEIFATFGENYNIPDID